MRASLFNVSVRLPGRDETFLFNTFTDAQAVLSADAARLVEQLARTEAAAAPLSPEEQSAVDVLAAEGFVVESHAAERAAVRARLEAAQEDATELRATILTTMQCNFACDYCVQGDHSGMSAGDRMSQETAAATLAWIEARLDETGAKRLVITFFGGEPLLNLPALYFLAENAHRACTARGASLLINIITNGLLLTPEVVDRLLPLGLNGVKVTLDGAREHHDRQRPLRGGQGTFDRIVANVARVAGRCRVAIGGNFEAGTEAFVELLDDLASREFAPLLDKVAFKPIIRQKPAAPAGTAPLRLMRADAAGTISAVAPAPASSACDTCHFADEQMIALREATRARGFRTLDGVHMGPCELHRRHAYTIGPDGALYACPGFAGERDQTIGGVTVPPAGGPAAGARLERLSPWREACGDCAFVPVCGGGCSVAARAETGNLLGTSCHKASFEAGVVTLAQEAAAQA